MTDWVCSDCGFTGDQSDACSHADRCPGNAAVDVLRGKVGSLATRLAIAHGALRALIDVVDDNENYVDDRHARAEVRAALNAANAYLAATPGPPQCRARTSGETHCASCMRFGNCCCLCGFSAPQERP